MKTGVFTCWCGERNYGKIRARNADCEKVAERFVWRVGGKLPGVHCPLSYKYMCSEPGQQMILQM